MSLINQMLRDLEQRRGGTSSGDQSLDGVNVAAGLAIETESHRRLLLSTLIVIVLGMGGAYFYALVQNGVIFAPLSRAKLRPDLPVVAPLRELQAKPSPLRLAENVATPSLAGQAIDMSDTASRSAVAALDKDLINAVERVEKRLFSQSGAGHAQAAAQPAASTAKATTRSASTAPARVKSTSSTAVDARHSRHAHGSVVVERPGSFTRTPSTSTTGARRDPAPRLDYAHNLLGTKRYDEALRALAEILHRDPKNISARELQSVVLLKMQRFADAEASLALGLRLVPGEPRLARPLAHLLYERHQSEAALHVLQQANPALAGDPEYYALRAALEQQLGLHDAAAATYQSLLAHDSNQGAWWAGLGISLEARADVPAALAAYRTAINDRHLGDTVREYVTRRYVELTNKSG